MLTLHMCIVILTQRLNNEHESAPPQKTDVLFENSGTAGTFPRCKGAWYARARNDFACLLARPEGERSVQHEAVGCGPPSPGSQSLPAQGLSIQRSAYACAPRRAAVGRSENTEGIPRGTR